MWWFCVDISELTLVGRCGCQTSVYVTCHCHVAVSLTMPAPLWSSHRLPPLTLPKPSINQTPRWNNRGARLLMTTPGEQAVHLGCQVPTADRHSKMLHDCHHIWGTITHIAIDNRHLYLHMSCTKKTFYIFFTPWIWPYLALICWYSLSL